MARRITLALSFMILAGACSRSGAPTAPTSTSLATTMDAAVSAKGDHGGAPIGDQRVNAHGVVSALAGTAANFQFTIGDQLIKGDASTEFFGHSAFTDLENDREVEVKGLQRTGFVYATRVHVNPPDEVPAPELPASIEGPLTAKAGTIPNLTLTVDGTTVTTTESTVVRRRGDVQDLSVLELGMTVHVEGARAGDGSLIARMIQIKDDAEDGQVEIEGSMGGLHGDCPVLQFTVNGFFVVTDAATTFTPACSTFTPGTKVTVKGTALASGDIKATSVEQQ